MTGSTSLPGADRAAHTAAGDATFLAKVPARARLGLKGPLAADWLAAQGVDVPAAPNRCTFADAAECLLVARLGSSEFFMEDAPVGAVVARLSLALRARPAGVYPVLREDTALLLTGPGADGVLAQVCNVEFAAVSLESRMLIMTLMIGVAVLVVPQVVAGERGYRIWCDPSFGPYLGDTLRAVVLESGGQFKEVSV